MKLLLCRPPHLPDADIRVAGHGTIGLTWEQWRCCFQLATAFGWEPAGTLPNIDQTHWGGPPAHVSEWDGAYFSNDLLEVTKADSTALAQALMAALQALVSRAECTPEQDRAFRRALLEHVLEVRHSRVSDQSSGELEITDNTLSRPPRMGAGARHGV